MRQEVLGWGPKATEGGAGDRLLVISPPLVTAMSEKSETCKYLVGGGLSFYFAFFVCVVGFSCIFLGRSEKGPVFYIAQVL